jgi:hypothetical protein
MDEYDAPEEQGSEGAEEPQAGSSVDWQAEAEKLKRENYKLRVKNRKVELSAKFGPEVVELIPEALPADEWEGYAEKLTHFRGAAPATEASTTEPEAQAETANVADPAAEQAMAAVTGLPSSGGQTPVTQMSGKELMDLYQSDPQKALDAARRRFAPTR